MPRRGVDLTEEQWRLVKSHAAKRGQTISEFFADVLAEIGMDGQIRPATTIAPRSVPAIRPPGDRPPDPVIAAPDERFNTRPFTPAPKPTAKRK